MDEYSEDMDVSVDVDVDNDTDIEVDIDTEVSDDIDMEIEDDIVEDEIEIEDDIVEDEIEIEDDIVEDEIEIEDDIIEDEVEIEDDIIEDEVEEDVVEDEVEVEEDVVEDEVEIEEDVVEDEVEVVEEPLEETEEVIDEVEEPLEETEEVVDEVEEPLEETEEVVDEVEEPVEEVTDEVVELLEETEEVVDEVEEPMEETDEVVDEVEEPLEETDEVVDEVEEPLEETEEAVEEIEEPMEEPEEVVEEIEEPIEEVTDEVEEIEEPMEEPEEVVEEIEEPIEEVTDEVEEIEEPLEETEEVVEEAEEPLEEITEETEGVEDDEVEELVEEAEEVEDEVEEIVDEDTQDNIAEDDSDDAVSESASDDTTDDLPEADIYPLEEPLETETVEVEESTENVTPPEQHTFDDWLNPENYDEDGHYIGQGQDFGYKPEGMDTAEYAEQIDQEALDVYEDHIKQQEDYIPDDVIDDMMNDVEDIATDNKDIIQDIEDDIVGDEIKQVDKNPEIENVDTVISDTAKQPERSAMDAMTTYMYEHNYGKGDYPEYSQDPEWQRLNQALQEELGMPVDIPAYDTDNISGGNIEPMSQNPGGNTEPVNVQQSQESALDAMTAYMYEHNYGKGDYPEYSQDPEWQKLNQALQEEMGIPVDAPVNDISPEIGDVKEQAAKDLMENYDVGKADFHDFDSDVASAVSDAVRDAKKDFPDLEVQYIGSIDSQVNGIREEYIDYYTKELEKIPDSGWTKDEMRTIAEYNADKTISNWGLDDTEGTFAWSLNIPKDVDPTGGKLEQYNGVAINNTYASDYNGFKEAKEEEVRTKHKPIGCNTPRATIDHELGHEIDNLLDASHDKKLMDLYDSMMSKGNAVNELSGYSQTNIKEFIAEGYSEYRNNPEPREYATKIYERLKELNQNRRRKSFWKKR